MKLRKELSIITIIVIALFLVLTATAYSFYYNIKGDALYQDDAVRGVVSIETDNRRIMLDVEVADTESKKEQGLSGRDDLEYGRGMLFPYDNEGHYYFWMKDMNFSIDIIWINNGKIIDITSDYEPSTYPGSVTSSDKASSILELKSGSVEQYDLEIGNSINIRY